MHNDPRQLPRSARWVLRHRFLLTLLGLLPIVALGLHSFYVSSRAMEDLVWSRLRAASQVTATLVDQAMNRSRRLVESIASLHTVEMAAELGSQVTVERILRIIVESDIGIERAIVTDASGYAWAAYPTEPPLRSRDKRDREWFRGVRETQATYVSAVYRRPVEPRILVIAISTPIVRDDRVVGYLVCKHDANVLAEWLQTIRLRDESYTFVIDHEGTVAAHPMIDRMADAYPGFADIELLQAARAGMADSGTYLGPVSGREMVASARPLEVSPGRYWVAVANQPRDQAFAPIDAMARDLGIVGGLLGVLAVLAVSAMGRTQRWLYRTEAFVDSIVENIPDMIFVKEAKSLRFVRFNLAAEKLLGFNRATMLGKTDYDFFPKEQADFFVRNDREVLRSGKTRDIPEERILTRHRGERILHTRKMPVWERPGRPAYLLGVSEDITERKRAEAEREVIWNLSRDILGVVDGDGRIRRVNPAFERTLGFSSEDARGQPLLQFVDPQDQQAVAQSLAKLHDGDTTVDFEARCANQRGELRWLAWRTFAHAGRIYAVARDVTTIREQLQACEVMQGSLADANREVERFARLVAYTMAEPLADIRTFAEELQHIQRDGGEAYTSIVQQLRQATRHMRRVIDSLRDYANVAASRRRFESVDLSRIAREVREEFTGELRAAKGVVTIGRLPTIDADPEQMHQMLRYFLEHALTFHRTTEPLRVLIDSHSRPGHRPHCDIVVEDNGVALALRHPEAIGVEPRTVRGGSGPFNWSLGLAVCRRIAEHHGGTISVNLNRGMVGASYTVSLPCRQPVPGTSATS